MSHRPRSPQPSVALALVSPALLYLCSRSDHSASAYRAVQRLFAPVTRSAPDAPLPTQHRSPQRSSHQFPSSAAWCSPGSSSPSLTLTRFLYSKPADRCKQPCGLRGVTLQGRVSAVRGATTLVSV